MIDFPVYSPSQTKSFLTCPTLRMLERTGWRLKYASKADLAGKLGTAFAAGVGTYYNVRWEWEKAGADLNTFDKKRTAEIAADMGVAIYNQEKAKLTGGPLTLEPEDEEYLEEGGPRVRKAVLRYCESDPLNGSLKVKGVEDDFGKAGGYARPDLLLWSSMGHELVDFKFKVKLDARYTQKTLLEYKSDHQLMQYAWLYRTLRSIEVARYRVVVVVAEPFKVHQVVEEISAETLDRWGEGMKRVWALMDLDSQGVTTPWMAARHYTQFGRCPYYNACFHYQLDRAMMSKDYINTKELA